MGPAWCQRSARPFSTVSGNFVQLAQTWQRIWRESNVPSLPTDIRRIVDRVVSPVLPMTIWAETQLRRINQRDRRPPPPHPLSFGDIYKIRQATLDYVSSMKILKDGKFLGYRCSGSTTEPILYGTLAALLIKHLYNR